MRYGLTYQSKTMAATADASNMTDNGYATFLQGGGSTQRLAINEIYAGGEDSASNPTTLVFGRDSTVAATAISGNMLAALDAAATAPGTVPVFGCVSTTKPQRSSTLHLLQLSLNTYGGISRWQARHGEEITVVGNTASLGEVSLSAVTGTGKISGQILFECV